jgi:hypothetical protein
LVSIIQEIKLEQPLISTFSWEVKTTKHSIASSQDGCPKQLTKTTEKKLKISTIIETKIIQPKQY